MANVKHFFHYQQPFLISPTELPTLLRFVLQCYLLQFALLYSTFTNSGPPIGKIEDFLIEKLAFNADISIISTTIGSYSDSRYYSKKVNKKEKENLEKNAKEIKFSGQKFYKKDFGQNTSNPHIFARRHMVTKQMYMYLTRFYLVSLIVFFLKNLKN